MTSAASSAKVRPHHDHQRNKQSMLTTDNSIISYVTGYYIRVTQSYMHNFSGCLNTAVVGRVERTAIVVVVSFDVETR